MRLPLGAIGAGALIALLGACGIGPATPVSDNALLFLSTATGLRAVHADSGVGVFDAVGAVPSADWSQLYSAAQDGGSTVVSRLDGRTGASTSAFTVEPNLVVRAVSGEGTAVALGPPRVAAQNGYAPTGRAATVVVVARDGNPPRRYELAGNLEPEAFSVDMTTLFVLDYSPALAPVRYQVRQVDLASGKVLDVISPDKDLQRAMGATARNQALAPDGRRLYTLYTLVGDDAAAAARPAFVHVLSLDGKWAHCVHLPPPFGNAPEGPSAVTVSADGRRVYVVDGTSGALAVVDTAGLRVVRTARMGTAPTSAVSAAVGADGKLYVARGTQVEVWDGTTLRRLTSWHLRDGVGALQAAPRGSGVYAALPNRVALLDANGSEVRHLGVANVVAISHVGAAPNPLVPNRSGFPCAC
jgi:YVTN family beta-propeller protein